MSSLDVLHDLQAELKDQQEALRQYFSAHPKDNVYELAADTANPKNIYRIPWHLLNGKPGKGSPMPVSRFFGIFSPWRGVNGPEDFRKLIQ